MLKCLCSFGSWFSSVRSPLAYFLVLLDLGDTFGAKGLGITLSQKNELTPKITQPNELTPKITQSNELTPKTNSHAVTVVVQPHRNGTLLPRNSDR